MQEGAFLIGCGLTPVNPSLPDLHDNVLNSIDIGGARRLAWDHTSWWEQPLRVAATNHFLSLARGNGMILWRSLDELRELRAPILVVFPPYVQALDAGRYLRSIAQRVVPPYRLRSNCLQRLLKLAYSLSR